MIITGLLFVFGVQLRYALMSLYGVPSAQITFLDLESGKCVQGFDLWCVWRGQTNGPYESFFRAGAQVSGFDWHLDSGSGQISFAESSGTLMIVPCKTLSSGTYSVKFYLQQIAENGTLLAEDVQQKEITILSPAEASSSAWFSSKDWQIDATTAEIYALVQNGDTDFQDWLYLRVFRNGVEVAHGDSAPYAPRGVSQYSGEGPLYAPKYGQTATFQSGDDLQLWSLATNTKLDSYIINPRTTTVTTPPIVAPPIVAPLTLWDIVWQYRTQIGISFIVGGCLIMFAQIFSRKASK